MPAKPVQQHPIVRDAPLPGFYPCLTLQLNVTRYQAAGQVRWVMVVREPSDGIEVDRRFQEAADDTEDLGTQLALAVMEAVSQVRWLQQGTIKS